MHETINLLPNTCFLRNQLILHLNLSYIQNLSLIVAKTVKSLSVCDHFVGLALKGLRGCLDFLLKIETKT